MRRGASLDSLWDGQEKDLRLRSCTCSFKEMISFDKEEDNFNDTQEVVALSHRRCRSSHVYYHCKACD